MYYYARIRLKCHKILGLQEHFTIRRTRLGMYMYVITAASSLPFKYTVYKVYTELT